MRIGLDLDGVVAHSVPNWINVLNTGFGTTYGPDELPDTHGTPDMAAFCDDHLVELLLPVRPMPGAVAAIERLRREGHELVVITARSQSVRRLTEAWLEYYGIGVDRLHFLEGAGKAATARAEQIDMLVEDTPKHALAVAEAGIPVLLFGAPYNRHLRHPLIHVCEGWHEVLGEINLRKCG
ncbi:MAG TPA: hypothetical protein VNT75_33060 [Symbiobacteriaceae bacterium]|nr:hypothetical protein [Symbiobacteriaceae bacterium]